MKIKYLAAITFIILMLTISSQRSVCDVRAKVNSSSSNS